MPKTNDARLIELYTDLQNALAESNRLHEAWVAAEDQADKAKNEAVAAAEAAYEKASGPAWSAYLAAKTRAKKAQEALIAAAGEAGKAPQDAPSGGRQPPSDEEANQNRQRRPTGGEAA